MTTNESSKSPLFILAPPRSFTSVICAMIGQHPQTYGLPEINLFAGDNLDHLARLYKVRPRFQHGLLRAIAQLGLGEQSVKSIEVAGAWLEDYGHESTKNIYYDLVELASPCILVDKSPMYVVEKEALYRINNAFPDAKYLHLVRHPLTTCESLLRLHNDIQSKGGIPVVSEPSPEKVWLKPHLRILDFLETLPESRHIRIQGEAFLSDVDMYLSKITEWLGIRTDSEAIEMMKHPENSPFACIGPFNARFGNDPGFLENPAFRKPANIPITTKVPLDKNENFKFGDEIRHYASLFGY